MSTLKILDGHNDTLTNIFPTEDGRRDESLSIVDRNGVGHIDLVRARRGGLGAGFFAVFISGGDTDRRMITANDGTTIEAGCSDPVPYDVARVKCDSLLDRMETMLEQHTKEIRLVRDTDELRRTIDDEVMAMILHYEGVEMLDESLEDLEKDHARGLRSLGPVWSRSNAFAHGVPFAFPCTPDIGPGLTEAGRTLVQRCNELGIMLDVSHLNYRGFMDIADLTDAPVVATHCGAHAVCASSRNLLDDQFDVIRDSGGIVGVNFHVGFLRPDGVGDPDTSLDVIADHLDYMVDRMGIDHVALGSDFDGATMPNSLGDCANLPKLVDVLRHRGWTEADLHALAMDNWLRVLDATWR